MWQLADTAVVLGQFRESLLSFPVFRVEHVLIGDGPEEMKVVPGAFCQADWSFSEFRADQVKKQPFSAVS